MPDILLSSKPSSLGGRREEKLLKHFILAPGHRGLNRFTPPARRQTAKETAIMNKHKEKKWFP